VAFSAVGAAAANPLDLASSHHEDRGRQPKVPRGCGRLPLSSMRIARRRTATLRRARARGHVRYRGKPGNHLLVV